MAGKDKFNLLEGKVIEALPSATFRVETAEGVFLCHLSGKMRINYIKVTPGDKVLIRPSPDKKRGIIVKRV
ncbi:MAG: translation initiation factor IF-1 [Candidatus Parcubacteria bacterium]|nr:translation initiation factor IF-1 [Patescibacteria group bacterium]BCX16122.1 MAG: translation initiation factor IF-1 [Candidatus Parcubacteria bacterium]